jgi:hypothetical protein
MADSATGAAAKKGVTLVKVGAVAAAKRWLAMALLKRLKKDGGNGIFIGSPPLFLDVERHILLCREMGGGESDVRAVVVLPSLSSPAHHSLWRWAFFLEKTELPSLLPDFPARLYVVNLSISYLSPSVLVYNPWYWPPKGLKSTRK